MPLPTVKIDPDGKSVHLDLEFSGPQFVIYSLNVWAADSNSRILKERGNNDNPEDDHYMLPSPASSNVGCKIVLSATVVDTSPKPGRYKIDLVISQDGEECGRLTASAKMTESKEDVFLIAKLTS